MKQAFLTALMILFIMFYSTGVFVAGMAVGGGLAIVKSINSAADGVSQATASINKGVKSLSGPNGPLG